jgi:hypothetical protein
MTITDKLQHFVAGLCAALCGCAVYLVLVVFGVVPFAGIVATPALCGLVAGITKEFCDWRDNQQSPGMHTVDVWDAAATTAPGVVMSVVMYAGALP